MADLNEALGYSRVEPRLSRIKNGNNRTDREGKKFEMGDNLAREIEEKLNLQTGTMDTPMSWQELYGEEDPRAKVMAVMESMPANEWSQVARVVDSLKKPTVVQTQVVKTQNFGNLKNGTQG